MAQWVRATAVGTSMGRAALFEMFCPMNMRSVLPTAETGELSVTRLIAFDRSVGAMRRRACGRITDVTRTRVGRPGATEASICSRPTVPSEERNVLEVIAPLQSVSAITPDTTSVSIAVWPSLTAV